MNLLWSLFVKKLFFIPVAVLNLYVFFVHSKSIWSNLSIVAYSLIFLLQIYIIKRLLELVSFSGNFTFGKIFLLVSGNLLKVITSLLLLSIPFTLVFFLFLEGEESIKELGRDNGYASIVSVTIVLIISWLYPSIIVASIQSGKFRKSIRMGLKVFFSSQRLYSMVFPGLLVFISLLQLMIYNNGSIGIIYKVISWLLAVISSSLFPLVVVKLTLIQSKELNAT